MVSDGRFGINYELKKNYELTTPQTHGLINSEPHKLMNL